MDTFTKYLESKDYTKSTRERYLRDAESFLNWYGGEAENCHKKDILKYLGHLQKKGLQNRSRSFVLTALSHYFTFLHKNGNIAQNPTALLRIRGTKKKTLHHIFTPEQLDSLCDDYCHNFVRNLDNENLPDNMRQRIHLSRQRNYVMLGFLVYQGLATNELQTITTDDININKATVKINGTRQSNGRTLPLKAPQIGSLINYINNIRPRFFEYCNHTERLFFALPEHGRGKEPKPNLNNTVNAMAKQLKSINGTFHNLKQIRASVITNWLKTEGLRKAQYLSGHRYISSTEQYLPNNLESLTDDIAKFNPF